MAGRACDELYFTLCSDHASVLCAYRVLCVSFVSCSHLHQWRRLSRCAGGIGTQGECVRDVAGEVLSEQRCDCSRVAGRHDVERAPRYDGEELHACVRNGKGECTEIGELARTCSQL
jgi:hypothetical protein